MKTLPKVGTVQFILRVTHEDRNKINRAAARLHLRQADFLRMATIDAAERTLKRMGDRDATRGDKNAP